MEAWDMELESAHFFVVIPSENNSVVRVCQYNFIAAKLSYNDGYFEFKKQMSVAGLIFEPGPSNFGIFHNF